MRYIFLTFQLLTFLNLFAQPGNYFLSHFSPSKESSDNVCFDIVQNQNGIMYFATRNGILEFDGRSWNLIPANGAVYSLEVASDTLYWAGANGYGIVVTDDQGDQKALTLSPPGINEVFASLAVHDNLYFLSNEGLYVCTDATKEPVTIHSSNLTGAFISFFEIYGSIYVTSEQEGLLKVEGNSLVRSSLGFAETDEILFATAEEDNYLIGLSNSRIFLYGNDHNPKEINLQDAQYAKANVIVEGKWLNPQLFVLATLRGGMIFVNAASGKTEEIVNYSTGLPDNEVYTLMTDEGQSIWAAHEYGFTRVSPFLPFRSYSHYEGLEGNLLCVLSFKNEVYVGTSTGLYKLVQEDIYDEIVSYIEVEVKPDQGKERRQKNSATEAAQQPSASASEPINESRKRGLFRFLKKKKTQPDEKPSRDEDKNLKSDEPPSQKRFESMRKVERVLRSAHYSYKKVNGINAKVTQLIEANGHLIAAGLSGAFEIDGLNANAILEEPSSAVFPSGENDVLFISTYKNEMKTFKRNNKSWIAEGLLNDLDDEINFMFQGRKEEYWFCAIDKVYRLEIVDGVIEYIQTIAFPNPNFDDVVGTSLDDKIMLANSDGFFQFDRNKSSFERIDSLGDLSYYFAANGNIWFRDAHDWNLFGKRPGRNLHLLNLYKDLRFVTSDENSENLWLITGNNELYRFFSDKVTSLEVDHPLILKAIRNAKQRVSRKGKIQFDQENSSVTFDVIQPDYLASESIEYRFQVEGLEKNWSAWSSTYNSIDFPYLPPGDYSLRVQAKDIFGNIQELEEVRFEVLAPYWKRTWFYALEFLLFASLVLLSFRLSTRYRVISRLLSLLTIILLIQFIQTVIGETFETRASPVTDFFVQVLVAVLILPVEGYLRNLLLRSVEPGSILHRFIPSKEHTEEPEEQTKD